MINVFTIAVDPSRLDRMATQLKHVFSSRLIRIPRHPELIEQLETIVGVEQNDVTWSGLRRAAATTRDATMTS